MSTKLKQLKEISRVLDECCSDFGETIASLYTIYYVEDGEEGEITEEDIESVDDFLEFVKWENKVTEHIDKNYLIVDRYMKKSYFVTDDDLRSVAETLQKETKFEVDGIWKKFLDLV